MNPASGSLLSVAGNIMAKSVIVKPEDEWPDYVFKTRYHLPAFKYVKNYIILNHHLPDLPSEEEVKKNGVDLGEMVKLQTKKIEELTCI